MRRGEIRWYTFAAPDKRRPVLLLTRTSVVDALNEIIVAPEAWRHYRVAASALAPSFTRTFPPWPGVALDRSSNAAAPVEPANVRAEGRRFL